MNNSYKKFAYYYDEVISRVDYRDWYYFVLPYLNKGDKILDLACGTGTFLSMISMDGYTTYGSDLSEEIIEIAKEKAKINHFDINFKVEDMTDFKYDFKFDIITCFFDSVNFLKSKNDIKKLLDSVYHNLKDGGYFIFDIFSKTMMNEYDNSILEEDYETFKIKWLSKIDNNKLIHDVTIYEDEDEIKEKYYEYYYDIKDFKDKRFELIKLSGDFNDDLEDEDERILFVLKKI